MKQQGYRNNINIYPEKATGDERREEIYHNLFKSSQVLPRTVTYKDIDDAFKNWVDGDLEIMSPEGVKFPTMTMFSNQRFSEYSQTWQHTDENKNLLLNFKSIARENNPKKGTLYGNMWNTPGQYYTIEKKKVLDDNGTESLLHTEMMMPTAVDLVYKVSIFTTKLEKINEFNEKINHLFDSCQVYIWPNEHPMAMSLDNISDESSYQIDDRQFYAQSFSIIVKGYIITDDHYRITETPIRQCIDFSNMDSVRKKADVSIEEKDDGTLQLTLSFPENIRSVYFTMDGDFEVTEVETNNVRQNIKMTVNGFSVDDISKVKLKDKDDISLKINKLKINNNSSIIFYGI